jgi:hypothetical protein
MKTRLGKKKRRRQTKKGKCRYDLNVSYTCYWTVMEY